MSRGSRSEVAPGHGYHHGSVREMLLAETFALAGEVGIERVSLREAARRVGVSHAAAYRHFPDRAGLIAAAATEGMWQLASELEDAATRAAGVGPLDRVCMVSQAYVAFALRERAAFRLMFAPELARKERFPELRAAADAASAPLLRELRTFRGQRRATKPLSPRATEEVRELAVAVWSLVHGLVLLELDGQLEEGELRISGADRADRIREVVERAVRRQLAGV